MIPYTHHSAKAIVIHNSQVLLLLRDNLPTISDPDTWDLPGGGVEAGETLEEGLKRELQEEINVIPKNYSYLGKLPTNDGLDHAVYLAILSDDEMSRLQLGNEGQELRFFDFDEALKLRFGNGYKYFLEKYGNALVKQLKSGEYKINPVEIGLVL